MNQKIRTWLAVAAVGCSPTLANGDLTLGTAGNFAVLAGTAVTNTGPSSIDGGGVGVYSGSSITGFPSGSLAAPYLFHSGDAVAALAQQDLVVAYNAAAALIPTQILTGQDLGGLTLTPGVYSFASAAQLTGTLTLNDLGNPDAQFVFQIGSTLTTATDSSVVTINGGGSPGGDVYWQVGSSATIGTDTAFEGHLLAFTSITMVTGSSILDGSALAIHGAVTLDTNRIVNPGTVPEPTSLALALIGASLVGIPALANKFGRRRPGGVVLPRPGMERSA